MKVDRMCPSKSGFPITRARKKSGLRHGFVHILLLLMLLTITAGLLSACNPASAAPEETAVETSLWQETDTWPQHVAVADLPQPASGRVCRVLMDESLYYVGIEVTEITKAQGLAYAQTLQAWGLTIVAQSADDTVENMLLQNELLAVSLSAAEGALLLYVSPLEPPVETP